LDRFKEDEQAGREPSQQRMQPIGRALLGAVIALVIVAAVILPQEIKVPAAQAAE